MKVKHLLTFVASLLCVGVNAQTWDFAAGMSDADKSNLTADVTNWTHETDKRFKNVSYMEGELVANESVIEFTKGLYFSGLKESSASDKIRLNYAEGLLQLNGSNLVVTLKGCKAGQTITVECKTAGSDARGFNVTNLTPVSGYFNSTSAEAQTNVGTVIEDGDVTLKTTKGMNVSLIKIEDSSSETAISDVETVQFNGLIGDELVLSNLAAGARVAVFDAQGREVLSSTSAGSNANISVSALRPGVYVLSAGNSSFKFVKR